MQISADNPHPVAPLTIACFFFISWVSLVLLPGRFGLDEFEEKSYTTLHRCSALNYGYFGKNLIRESVLPCQNSPEVDTHSLLVKIGMKALHAASLSISTLHDIHETPYNAWRHSIWLAMYTKTIKSGLSFKVN